MRRLLRRRRDTAGDDPGGWVRGTRFRYAEFAHFGAIVHATCDGSLIVQFQRIVTQVDLVAAQAEADAAHDALTTKDQTNDETNKTDEVAQYITRRVDGKLLTERVVRGKDEFDDRAGDDRGEAGGGGGRVPDAAKAVEESGGGELGGDRRGYIRGTRGEAQGRRQRRVQGELPAGGGALHTVPRAKPSHRRAREPRGVFLKMGEHAKALDDASSCASIARTT